MTALIAAVFLASVMGSMHCAGMCGAFLAFAVASDEGAAPDRARLNVAYNAGRFVTYIILGAISGAVGAAVDLGASAVGVQRAAAVLAGSIMTVFGVVAILRLRGVRVPRMPLPPGLRAVVSRGHRAAAGWPPLARATTVGLLTTLLPCGWLYAFAITAAGTADPFRGAVTMAAFWAGTLPMMVSLGVGFQTLAAPIRQRAPLVTSLALVAVGLATVAGRLTVPAMAGLPGVDAREAMDSDAAIKRVQTLKAEESPCCTHEQIKN